MSLLTVPVHVLSPVGDPDGGLLLVMKLSQLQETEAGGFPSTELQVKLNGSPSNRILGTLAITGSDGGSVVKNKHAIVVPQTNKGIKVKMKVCFADPDFICRV